MAKTLQFKRYANTTLSSTTGADGELIIDANTRAITVHDGVTAGGNRIATESYVANSIGNISNALVQYAANTSNSDLTIALAAFNEANIAATIAQAAYNQANTPPVTIDTYARTTANNASSNTIYLTGIEASQNANVSLLFGIESSQNTSITAAFNQANTAASNTVYLTGIESTQNTSITAAFTEANTANTLATSAFNLAFSANNLAQAAYNQANTGGIDSYARTTANTASNNITVLFAIETTQNNNINAATTLAQAAFNQANTGGSGIDSYARTTANTASSNTVYLTGIETTQNTNINTAITLAQAAFNQANVGGAGTYSNNNVASYLTVYTGNVSAGNVTATNSITTNYIYTTGSNGTVTGVSSMTFSDTTIQNTAFQGIAIDNTARANANAAFIAANSANTLANSALNLAQSAYNQANTGGGGSTIDSYARTTANNASSNTIYIFGVNATQNANVAAAFSQANTATTLAQAAFNKANTGGGGGSSSSIANNGNTLSVSSNGTIYFPGGQTLPTSGIFTVNTTGDSSYLGFEVLNTSTNAFSEMYMNDLDVAISVGNLGNLSAAKNWTFNSDGSTTYPAYILPGFVASYPDSVLIDLYGNGALTWTPITTSIVAGSGINISSTGEVGGTGQVTISASGGGGGSGVTSIIAGTNITISSTGSGGTGAVTINSTGGSGGSTFGATSVLPPSAGSASGGIAGPFTIPSGYSSSSGFIIAVNDFSGGSIYGLMDSTASHAFSSRSIVAGPNAYSLTGYGSGGDNFVVETSGYSDSVAVGPGFVVTSTDLASSSTYYSYYSWSGSTVSPSNPGLYSTQNNAYGFLLLGSYYYSSVSASLTAASGVTMYLDPTHYAIWFKAPGTVWSGGGNWATYAGYPPTAFSMNIFFFGA